jgi:hypothetical protein
MSNGITRLEIVHIALHGARLEFARLLQKLTPAHNGRSRTENQIFPQAIFAIT